MWELVCKEGWTLKNWCFQIVVLEKTLENPLDCKEIKPVNPKWNQSWIFIGRTDAEAEAPILWPPDVKSQLIRKDPDAGKDWRQEKKGVTDDKVVGWHYWLNGHEFEQAPGDGEGQGSLACCSPWGCRVRHDWVAEQQCIMPKYKYILHYVLLKCAYYNALGVICYLLIYCMVLPWWLGGKEFTWQCKRGMFNLWVRKIPWRKKWQPTPVFLPGKSRGQRSLAGYCPWGSQRVRHDLAMKEQ